jgi:hypothetical protein
MLRIPLFSSARNSVSVFGILTWYRRKIVSLIRSFFKPQAFRFRSVNSISGERVVSYGTSYALYKVYHTPNPLGIYVVSHPRKGTRHIGFHWSHERFCWKSVEMSHHDSIHRDLRNQLANILLVAHRLEIEAQLSFPYPRMDIGNHPFAIYLCLVDFGGRSQERPVAFCHGEHGKQKLVHHYRLMTWNNTSLHSIRQYCRFRETKVVRTSWMQGGNFG